MVWMLFLTVCQSARLLSTNAVWGLSMLSMSSSWSSNMFFQLPHYEDDCCRDDNDADDGVVLPAQPLWARRGGLRSASSRSGTHRGHCLRSANISFSLFFFLLLLKQHSQEVVEPITFTLFTVHHKENVEVKMSKSIWSIPKVSKVQKRTKWNFHVFSFLKTKMNSKEEEV